MIMVNRQRGNRAKKRGCLGGRFVIRAMLGKFLKFCVTLCFAIVFGQRHGLVFTTIVVRDWVIQYETNRCLFLRT